jgi:hypothetical protein
MLLNLPLSRRYTVEHLRDLRRHAIRGHNERGVQMNIPLRDAACRMAQQTGDRQFGEPEIAGNARESVAQNVRRYLVELLSRFSFSSRIGL